MILESIIGIDSISIGDVIVDTRSGNHEYRVDDIDYFKKDISITYLRTGGTYGWYGISTFKKIHYKVRREFMPYDPNQQGETSDDI